MSRYVSFRDFDWVLLILVLLICGLGVVEIYSATLHTKFVGVHIKQVYWILGGMLADVHREPVQLSGAAGARSLLYIVSIASLVAVMLFGKKYLGARRWIKMRRHPLPAIGMGEARS